MIINWLAWPDPNCKLPMEPFKDEQEAHLLGLA